MVNAARVQTLKGKVVGTIQQSGSMLVVVWITGEMMIFRGPATIIFHDGRNELHVVFDGKTLKTHAVIVESSAMLQPKAGKLHTAEISIERETLSYFKCLQINRT